jgi:hypothetical protein
MGKYLDLLSPVPCEISELSEISHQKIAPSEAHTQLIPFTRLFRTLSVLEARCPDLTPVDRWQMAVEDGRRFLATWGAQAEALGWTVRDLFGLLPVPADPHPSFNRLSRYDATGLVWLLRGRTVVALTETAAAIQNPTAAVTVYRRHNKPALGPLGDSLEDLKL